MVISTFKMHCIVFIGFALQGKINWWNLGTGFRGSGDRERNWGRKKSKKGPVDHTIAKTTFVHRLVKNHSPLSEKLHQKV